MKSLKIILICFIILSLTGCSKDQIIDGYDYVIKKINEHSHCLTDNSNLEGTRIFGQDHYVGHYQASYHSFSSSEYLFGGTSLKRENGQTIQIKCYLTVYSGEGRLIWKNGSQDDVCLMSQNGYYEEVIEIPSADHYIVFEGHHFDGTIDLRIK